MTLKEIIAVKKKATRVDRLPEEAQQVIENYKRLKIGNKDVCVSYYINSNDHIPCRPGEHYRVKRSLKRELVAKGNPTEIERIIQKIAAKEGFSLETASPEQIQDFMVDHGIGIDCSGFVVWVLNEIAQLKLHKNVWDCITIPAANPLKKIIIKLRPLENIGAATLRDNAEKIVNLKDVHAGDILITRPYSTYTHVILITEVGFNSSTPLYIDYLQSTQWYSARNGLREGTIVIKHPDKYLEEQEWFEDNAKKNYTYTGVKNDPAAAMIMRLKCFSKGD